MDKKEIVKVLGDHFGVKPRYMGAPSFAYQIETTEGVYSIDHGGKITTLEGTEVELDRLLTEKAVIKQDDPLEPQNPVKPVDQVDLDAPVEPTANSIDQVEIVVPLEGHTGQTIKNLVNLIYSKQVLIRKSLGIEGNIIEDVFVKAINEVSVDTKDDFKTTISEVGEQYCPGITFDFERSTIIFKFFQGEKTSEKVHAYTQFVGMLNQTAKKLKYTSPKDKYTDNARFTFRLFLIRIGMVGEEYKMTRKVLLEKLEGNSAFRNGRKPEKIVAETNAD